jgi:hypothetical protein
MGFIEHQNQHHMAIETNALQKTASTRLCYLCAAERMIIGHNFTSTNQRRKIINLKSKMRGICSCKRGSYSSQDPIRKGGSDEYEKSPKTELVGCYVWRGSIFWGKTINTCVCGLNITPG